MIQDRIEAIIGPSLTDMGYGIVRVRFAGGSRATLQIMAERLDGVGMSVDDCSEISRVASALLDVEDPIPTAYELEVSSPGIDRPLVRRPDFDRFAGFEVKIETSRPVEGRKKFKGVLDGLGEGDVVRVTEVPEAVAPKKGRPKSAAESKPAAERPGAVQIAIPFDAIAKAKLVLTDDLIKASPDLPRMS